MRVRLDGGFASPALFQDLERPASSMSSPWPRTRCWRPAPSRISRPLRAEVGDHPRDRDELSRDRAIRAKTWPHPRRTIIKAEVVWHAGREPRDNPRFVITNLRQTPAWIYTHVYCARGDS